ncbi:MAG: UvrD-helicase domain-containing protein [Bdellovibrionota bacterium]|nr:UvrD-helicase domain-containing protein [Bdellovibrionota bacterium]
MISLNKLNPEQKKAAKTIEGPLLILAGAGSGKTGTITCRIAHMVENLGIPGESILGVSFTNKAAAEMKERVKGLLGHQKSKNITLCTFHSLGIKILKNEIERLGYYKNFTIYDTGDQISLVREALRNFRSSKQFDFKQVLSKIGYLKNSGVSAEEFGNSQFFDPEDAYDDATEYTYRYYQEKLKFFNAIDFDDILFLTLKLFKQNPELAGVYSEKYRYIMIDEYQDTNPLQFQIVMQLTSRHQNLCVVGDDDQSIYSFRGADIRNILDFEKNFPNATIIKLEQNYRSTMPILALANAVIKENKHRREKTLWSQQESEVMPILWSMADPDHESQILAEEIARYQSEGKSLSDVAVLYRSHNLNGPLEDQLRIMQIPYKIVGGQKFYEKKEVKDLMGYLFVILNTWDELSLRRILNVPPRGIGPSTLQKYLEKSKEMKLSLFQTLEKYPALDPKRTHLISSFCSLIRSFQRSFRQNTLDSSLKELVEKINYNSFIEKQYEKTPKQIERRKNDVLNFIESAQRFSKRGLEDGNLKNFVEKLLLQDSQSNKDSPEEEESKPVNEVSLMTLHSSKGLEFDIVYLIGVEEETLPHKKIIQEGGDINEERRLCYVGITRARKKLIMTFCKERVLYGKKQPRFPSRFISPLKETKLYVEQDRTTFGHLNEEEAENYKKDFFSNLLKDL